MSICFFYSETVSSIVCDRAVGFKLILHMFTSVMGQIIHTDLETASARRSVERGLWQTCIMWRPGSPGSQRGSCALMDQQKFMQRFTLRGWAGKHFFTFQVSYFSTHICFTALSVLPHVFKTNFQLTTFFSFLFSAETLIQKIYSKVHELCLVIWK